jgi:hypothetical protein
MEGRSVRVRDQLKDERECARVWEPMRYRGLMVRGEEESAWMW